MRSHYNNHNGRQISGNPSLIWDGNYIWGNGELIKLKMGLPTITVLNDGVWRVSSTILDFPPS